MRLEDLRACDKLRQHVVDAVLQYEIAASRVRQVVRERDAAEKERNTALRELQAYLDGKPS